MQYLLLPRNRAVILLKEKTLLSAMAKKLRCRIELQNDNEITIDGEAYDEYNAKNVMSAFAKGFDANIAYKLLQEDYYFTSIDLKDMFKGQEKLDRIKARIIGEHGKTRTYIEEVSGAKMQIYGDTVSLIGTIDEINTAKAAVEILIDGGTHKKAYAVMEGMVRRLKEEALGIRKR